MEWAQESWLSPTTARRTSCFRLPQPSCFRPVAFPALIPLTRGPGRGNLPNRRGFVGWLYNTALNKMLLLSCLGPGCGTRPVFNHPCICCALLPAVLQQPGSLPGQPSTGHWTLPLRHHPADLRTHAQGRPPTVGRNTRAFNGRVTEITHVLLLPLSFWFEDACSHCWRLYDA